MERTGRVGIGEPEVHHTLNTPAPDYGGYIGTESPTPTELLGCQREVNTLPEGAEPLPDPTDTRDYGLQDARTKKPAPAE